MKKTLKIMIIFLDIVLIAFFSIMKYQYYAGHSLGSNPAFSIGWIIVSMLITLIPMLAQIGCLVFDKADHYAAAFLVPLFLWIGEYVFEFISLLGSAVCLDKRWSHMAEKMMGGFLFFLIPLVLSLLMHLLHKRTRPLQAGA